jgi:pimeloyl-ACP methyl ester carboxylesterase
MPFETTRIRLPGGLSGLVSEPTTVASRPPVLLLHGMMGGAWQFQWLQSALGDAGFTSLAIDYRGHHDSPPVQSLGRTSVHDYLLDALVACAYLGGKPIVVGQSMGGLIAQLLAERDAALAAVLVCSLPPAGIRWRGARDPRKAWSHLPDILRGHPLKPVRAELDFLILNRIPRRERPRFFNLQVPESSRAGAQIAFGLVRVHASAVTCPVLSISASHDQLVLADVGAKLARRYHGEHITLDGAGHYALVGEPGWQDASTRMIDWLERTVPSDHACLRAGSPTSPSPAWPAAR